MDEVRTIMLNDKEFIIMDELEENNEKYYSLVTDNNEFQIVKEIKDNSDIIIKTVSDKKELEKLEFLFTKKLLQND